MNLAVIYLHGFASSPGSNKATIISKRLRDDNRIVTIPDLNCGDFTAMTMSKILSLIDDEAKKLNAPFILVGSSMGGYAAALYAVRRNELLKGLTLMAPAFNFAKEFTTDMGVLIMENWRKNESHEFLHFAYNKLIPLSYNFISDLEKHAPFPDIGALPCEIIHGANDEVVPCALSREFAKTHRQVNLHEREDAHDLAQSVDYISSVIDDFLAQLES